MATIGEQVAAQAQRLLNAKSDIAEYITGNGVEVPAGMTLDGYRPLLDQISTAVTIVTVPSQTGTLTYNGGEQSPQWANYDSRYLELGGVASATDAGTYEAAFTPRDRVQWADGSTEPVTVQWAIGKAQGSMSLDKTSLALDLDTLEDTITVTRPGDGAISAVSSAPDVVAVAVEGNVVTVTALDNGSATVTISVAEGSNYTAPADRSVEATATLISRTLNDNSWAYIKAVSDAGEGANYWAVGDTKTITINGKVGATTFSNLSIDAFILGFNHNSSREGSNRIHFKIGKISGTHVALVDSKYGSNVTSSGYFNMNTSDTNSDGWNGSYMRKTLLGNSGTPSSPPSSSLLAALPSDLRAVMKAVTKYSDNTGGGSDTASYVTSTTDYLFLLAEFEYHGARTYANSAEKNYQAQYAYYKAGNSKVHYQHSDTGSAAEVFCRSVRSSFSDYFCRVSTGGSAISSNAYYSGGLAPGFCV